LRFKLKSEKPHRGQNNLSEYKMQIGRKKHEFMQYIFFSTIYMHFLWKK